MSTSLFPKTPTPNRDAGGKGSSEDSRKNQIESVREKLLTESARGSDCFTREFLPKVCTPATVMNPPLGSPRGEQRAYPPQFQEVIVVLVPAPGGGAPRRGRSDANQVYCGKAGLESTVKSARFSTLTGTYREHV